MYILKLTNIDPFFLLNCFFVYSFFGWIFECIVMSIEEKAIVNRGFIKGPLCTVYGVGALSAYYFLQPLSNSFWALFVCGAVFATIVELITAKAMLKLLGDFWWDYSNKPFNYKGVICLESTVCWGLMTVAMFVFIQPSVEGIVNLYYPYYGRVIAVIMLVGYCADFSTTFYRIHSLKNSDTFYELDLKDIDEFDDFDDFDFDELDFDDFDFEPQEEVSQTKTI